LSEKQAERKDFSEWAVTIVYMAQEGVCAKCGNTLALGFHRHHKDGNRSNNSVNNLELLCMECHRATYRGAKRKRLQSHREYEKKVFDNLNEVIESTLKGSLAGSTTERLLEAMSTSLKLSRSINHIDDDIEYPPPTITVFRRLVEQNALTDAYMEGFKACLSAVRVEAKGGPG